MSDRVWELTKKLGEIRDSMTQPAAASWSNEKWKELRNELHA